jgi:hypothetical protein
VLNEKHRHTRSACPLCDRIDALYRAGAVMRGIWPFAQALLHVDDQNSGLHQKDL